MITPEIRARLESETQIGVEPVLAHGGMDAQALRIEDDTGHRELRIDQAVRARTGPGAVRCTGRAFPEPFCGIGAGFPKPATAVLARELARLSRAAIDLGALKRVILFVRSRWRSFEALPGNTGLFRWNPKI